MADFDLARLIQLFELESRLNDIQSTIDEGRAAIPHDGLWQYEMDIKQSAVDRQREMIEREKALYLSPN